MFSTVIGSVGVALLLLAFLLNLIKRLAQDSVAYTTLNLVGATLSGYASWLIGFIPFVVLEGTWAAVAAIALVRIVARLSAK
ncbi:MAG: hypothetical protein BWY52_02325 [Chloroflexi bacterium ADurb.Bin325]|nr:MAG: hypothetical protein BWY52_02325 [Chloroflexi bacterium ADurb.Bin325]